MKPVIKQLEFVVIYIMVSVAIAGVVRYALIDMLEFLRDLPVTVNYPGNNPIG